MTRIVNTAGVIADWLDSGLRLDTGQFTYSVPGSSSVWPGYGAADEPFAIGFALPDAGLTAAFVDAVKLWDDLIAPDFTRLADDASTRGEIRLAIARFEDDDLSAYAYFPTYVGGKPGDIWLNAEGLPEDWSAGSYGYLTLIHELGHSLGLEHSFVSPVDPKAAAAPETLDSSRFTVMSYNWLEERHVTFGMSNGRFYADFNRPAPETPMVLDIAAIQEIYGADPDTRKGDTTYKLEAMSSSLRTIYDAGGNDTLDLREIAYSNTIDLQPGGYSSIGAASVKEQIDYWIGKFPSNAQFIRQVFNEELNKASLKAYTFVDNVAIALSTVIENVLGGSGADEIHGNSADNLLVGNLGNDKLVGLRGKDRLEGGAGDDVLYGDDIPVAAPKPVDPVIVPEPEPEPQPVTPAPVGGGGTGLLVVSTAGYQSITLHSHSLGGPDSHSYNLNAANWREFLFAPATDAGIAAPRAALLSVVVQQDPSDPASGPEPEPRPDTETEIDPTPTPDVSDSFDDSLYGGDGDDALIGGPGRDFLSGGAGADQFRFAPGDIVGGTAALADVVSDFSQAEGDVIDLGAIDAIAGGSDDAFRFIGSAAFSGAGGELRTVQHDRYLLLEGDITPDGIADFAIRFDGLTSLSVSSIIV